MSLLIRTMAIPLIVLGAGAPLELQSNLRADSKSSADLARQVAKLVDADESRLLGIFKQVHANPELGFQEVKTSALIAKEWRELGYEVHTGIGKTGVVAVLKNGSGPVVMFRGDMDGLPVKELTNLPYASKTTATNSSGGFVPVMHACGHDTHITFLIGVAKVMKELRNDWSGTLVLVAQPAEELVMGARAMVKDGLYDRVPKPDVLIASHVSPGHPAGAASVRAGRRMAGTDQIDVIIHGIGGHGSAPQRTKDPVVMGAMAVMAYQTLVSRVVDPQEPSVLTVGSFQAGDANNVIPDSATLKVNLRWFNPKVREQLITGVKRITDAIAIAADMPRDKMPQYVMKGSSFPVINSDEAAPQAEAALQLALGKTNVLPGPPPVMGSEDFQELASTQPSAKILFVQIGCGPADLLERVKQGNPPAANHNSKFKVELPAVAAGTKANVMMLLEFLKKK